MSSIATRRPYREARKLVSQPIESSESSWTPPRPPTPFPRDTATLSKPQLPSVPLPQIQTLSRSTSPEAASEVDRLLSPVTEDPSLSAKQRRRERNRRNCLKYRQTPKGRARVQAAASKFSKTPAGRALRKKHYYSPLGQANEARAHIRRRIESELKAATEDLLAVRRVEAEKRSKADVARAELMVKIALEHYDEFMRQKEVRLTRLYGRSMEGVVKKEEGRQRTSGRGIEELKQSLSRQRRERWELIEKYLEENEGL